MTSDLQTAPKLTIALIGAAGGVGRRVAAQAAAEGHRVRGLVRREEQADMLSLYGAEPVLGDLMADWEAVLDGTDAVVWAAGAGASGAFEAVDQDALIRLVDVLKDRGPRRLVVVSSMGVDRPEQMPPFLSAVLRVKAVSDAYVQASGLEYTIVRPAGLTDAPGTGQIQIGMPVQRGMIARDDVAQVVLTSLTLPQTIQKTFEIVGGEVSIAEALSRV
ncbi:SDR family oxidoreductase [Deinococcus aquatilis]|jgi:uncharacterized protein YbjT (DUF2867 family)|uniref:SDR family oxidoreductase n=1 Tax=Deinococcus aquatilis TaxID=519440 RepID=UPI0003618FEC|nr:SDR family oxidoreductase [Deinococcus aquatilis]